MNKDLIKYGLLALGAYLIYRYVQEQGGISNLFGATTGTGTGTGAKCATGLVLNAAGQCVAPAATNAGGGTNTGSGTGSGSGSGTAPTTPVLDMTGLQVIPDVNNSLTGYVKINGVPTKLSIITGTGAIYDVSGSDITATLQGEGIDIVAIRNAFQSAGPPANFGKCTQPNIFKDGICVDPFTLQPIPNTMTQAQQNAGVSGLGEMRFTPPWLM